MKVLHRPNRSSRFAPHTVPMTKMSISMKRSARYPATRWVRPALVLSGAALATRGGDVASASFEVSTKKSTAVAKHSDDERQLGTIARTFNVRPRPIIADDPPGVPTAPLARRLSSSSDGWRTIVLVARRDEEVAQESVRLREIEDGVPRELAQSNG